MVAQARRRHRLGREDGIYRLTPHHAPVWVPGRRLTRIAAPHPAPFDTAYMKTLYERGFALGRAGYPWANAPPGIETTAAR